MNYYIFDRVPGYHPKYTYAVLAVNANDARQWMRTVNKGGVMIRTITSGEVKADMGALTTAAEQRIREQRELEEVQEPKL
jgi:hypothetical protein